METTFPCFTEAMYMLGKVGGFAYQLKLWELRGSGFLKILDISDAAADRMAELMKQYQDLPMDLADASLVAVAESRGDKSVFTIDSDFYVYRLKNERYLEVLS